MSTRPRVLATVAALLAALGLLQVGLTAPARAAVPTFTVQFLGSGAPTAINNSDTVVGSRTDPATGRPVPLVSVAGASWSTLPLPAGATGGFATDVNDAGVVVGVADLASGRRAVRWTPSGGGYVAQVLPLLAGEATAYATAINSAGQIVGARAGLLGTPFGYGWVYSDATGTVGLLAEYGWDAAAPDDINDAGVILDGTQTFDLATRTVSSPGSLLDPRPVNGLVLNNAGQILGISFYSGSLNIARLYRYTPASGWQYLTGTTRYTAASDMNEGGDAAYTEGLSAPPGLYLDGLGVLALNDLLDPAARTAGWSVSGGPKINDARVIAVSGRNSVTGQSGTVLLRPAGALAPPAAPTDLTAVPHPATPSEPYVSINLSWRNGDPLLTRTYELERRVAGQATWTSIPLVPPAMGLTHQDTTVAPATTYEYRVRAVGVGGPGPWSATATATSPSQPLDTTAPQVSITAPADGATVSGTVTVTAEATDDVGVDTLRLQFWNQFTGQYVELGEVSGQGVISVPWNTAGLTPAAYTLRATAADATRNVATHEVSVTVAAAVTTMRVTSISLSTVLRQGVVTATGVVTVRTPAGAAVSGAVVAATWTRPDGSTRRVTATTTSLGRATLSTTGSRGTYRLTVTGVTRAGFTFDPAGSVLTRSITR